MKNRNKKYIKNIITISLILLVCLFVAMIMKYNQTGQFFVPETALVTGIIFMMAMIMIAITRYMTKQGEKIPFNRAIKKIIPAILIFYASAYLAAYFSVSFGVFVWFLIKGRDLNEYFPQLIEYELRGIHNIQFLFWLLLFTAVFFYILIQKLIKKEQKLREENLKYKYQNLKAQVNPHFLFNSLNALSEMVYEDAERADNFIQRLSKTYRYILDHEETDLVHLDKEIDFVKQYFELLKERDQDKILLEIEIKDVDRYKVIPVSLQILVENALKHNSRSEKTPLLIRIELIDDYLVVSNSIQRKNTLEHSAGLGLKNLKERVKLILDKNLNYSEENGYFIVRLPVMQIKQ